MFHGNQQPCIYFKGLKTPNQTLDSLVKGFFPGILSSCSYGLPFFSFVSIDQSTNVYLHHSRERELRYWHHSFKLEIRFPSTSRVAAARSSKKVNQLFFMFCIQTRTSSRPCIASTAMYHTTLNVPCLMFYVSTVSEFPTELRTQHRM